jgi:hypothetical protein
MTIIVMKIVGSAILIPSAPPQNVVYPADCSVCSRRMFRTTSFARTCSAHPEHTKEIHPQLYCLLYRLSKFLILFFLFVYFIPCV